MRQSKELTGPVRVYGGASHMVSWRKESRIIGLLAFVALLAAAVGCVEKVDPRGRVPWYESCRRYPAPSEWIVPTSYFGGYLAVPPEEAGGVEYAEWKLEGPEVDVRREKMAREYARYERKLAVPGFVTFIGRFF